MNRNQANQTEPLLKYADLLLRKGMQEEAAAHLEELLRQHPGCAKAHYSLAVVQSSLGLQQQAAAHLQDAVALDPSDVKALNALGVAFQQMGRDDEAASCYREAVRVDPRYQDAQINLALLFTDHGRLCAAQRQLEGALRHQPGAIRLWYNLANNLQYQGKSVEAIAAYRETLRLEPDHLGALQNLLFALHYPASFSDLEIYLEHLAVAGRAPFRAAAAERPDAPVAGARRIRIGYLSPDFRVHSVASFIEPILMHHDRGRFEIYCYANVARPDQTTERLKAHAEFWRDICPMGDDEAAGAIARDGIDILVDLAGHTAGNRLPLLARRPAPLQVTWIGYPDTTALPQVDYRITDRHADPPGRTEPYHSERLVRLERSFSCYQPPAYAPPVAPLPCLTEGRITFGSFNNLAKVTPEVIALWSRVLLAVPGSRMLLKCSPLADAEVCVRLLEEFRVHGVSAQRVELNPGNPSPDDHLAQYGRVDIALDTFPYNGTTTTCEALWMGVPVVSLAGTRHASRTGVSILTNCGLPHLVAPTPERFVAAAAELAAEPAALGGLRRGMRERMRLSPLLDGPGVTRELEHAYLGMLQERRGGAGQCVA